MMRLGVLLQTPTWRFARFMLQVILTKNPAYAGFFVIMMWMSGKNLFIKLTYLLYIIVVLHILALYFSWYWSIWWYDILVHFLGGFWIGGVALWFYLRHKNLDVNIAFNRLIACAVSVFAVIVIGVLWELFEFSLDTFIVFRANDVWDTVSDLGADVVGGLAALIVIMTNEERNRNRIQL